MSEISGKWYQSLFWLLIVCTVARTISNGEGDGRLYTLLWFVNILATVVYGAVLLKMKHFSAHFRMAGFCKAASAAVGVLSSAMSYLLDGSLLVALSEHVVLRHHILHAEHQHLFYLLSASPYRIIIPCAGNAPLSFRTDK